MLKHGCEGNVRIFSEYATKRKERLSSRDGSLASTYRLATGDVLYAPVQVGGQGYARDLVF